MNPKAKATPDITLLDMEATGEPTTKTPLPSMALLVTAQLQQSLLKFSQGNLIPPPSLSRAQLSRNPWNLQT
jgi:hypothetical protein